MSNMLICFLVCFACFLIGITIAVLFYYLFPNFRPCPFYTSNDCPVDSCSDSSFCPFYGSENCVLCSSESDCFVGE